MLFQFSEVNVKFKVVIVCKTQIIVELISLLLCKYVVNLKKTAALLLIYFLLFCTFVGQTFYF